MAEELYSEIFQSFGDDVTPEKILSAMIQNKDKQIRMKTQIITPVEITMLHTLADYYKKIKFPILAKFVSDMANYYEELMVSYQRKSRQELTSVLTARMEDKSTSNSMFDRLIGKNKKERE